MILLSESGIVSVQMQSTAIAQQAIRDRASTDELDEYHGPYNQTRELQPYATNDRDTVMPGPLSSRSKLHACFLLQICI